MTLAAASLFVAGLNRVLAQSASGPPRVVLLLTGSIKTEPETAEIFRAALRGLGYRDGQNVIIDIVETDSRFERLPAMIEAVLKTAPKVIVTAGSQTVGAVRRATATVPIVAISVGDPVEQGLAKSLAAPGGNVTGNALIQQVSDEKTVELVKEILPKALRIAVLTNPANPINERTKGRFRTSASRLGVATDFLDASSAAEIEAALGRLPAKKADALVVANDGLFRAYRRVILDAVARMRVPAVYAQSAFVQDGGLISYAYDRKRLVQNAAGFVDRILKGKTPAELPFEQPTHFELAINLKTAKALGLRIPQPLLIRATLTFE